MQKEWERERIQRNRVFICENVLSKMEGADKISLLFQNVAGYCLHCDGAQLNGRSAEQKEKKGWMISMAT